MTNSLVSMPCPSCGAQLTAMLGTQTRCANCGNLIHMQFSDAETQQLSDELAIGLQGLRGIKQQRLEGERAAWELQKEKYRFHQEHDTKECPHCQTIVPYTAKFCLECGLSVSTASRSVQGTESIQIVFGSNPAKICRGCGTVNSTVANFCKLCGDRF